jgi:cyclic patellamide precursor peptide PatG
MKPLELTAEASLGRRFLNRTWPYLEVEPIEVSWSEEPVGRSDRITPNFLSGGKPIYAYGRVAAKFPSLSLEKEFYQALEIVSPRQPNDQFDVENTVDVDVLNQELNRTDLIYSVLSKPENIYIARDMVWVFEDLANVLEYVITPASDEQVTALVNAIAPGRDGLAGALILIGEMVSGTAGSGLIDAPSVRLVALRKQLTPTAAGGDDGTFQQIQSLLLNTGANRGNRALNFVLLNHGDFYSTTQNLLQPVRGTPTAYGFSIVGAETLVRKINQDEMVDVVFIYAPEASGSRIQYYASVNVTSLFPFIVVPFTKYLSRNQA